MLSFLFKTKTPEQPKIGYVMYRDILWRNILIYSSGGIRSLGKTNKPLKLGESGMHYYTNPWDCYDYSHHTNIICKVEILGETIFKDYFGCTNQIKILGLLNETITGRDGSNNIINVTYKNGKIYNSSIVPLVNVHGDEIWCVDGKLHREDGPAVTINKYYQEWYMNNKLHRLDGPAVIDTDNYKEWWVLGLCHREDGPAVMCGEYQIWKINGMQHREDGPAVIFNSGEVQYFYKDQLHREDGPAVIYEKNDKNDPRDGEYEWYNHGNLHRTDGPARKIIESDKTYVEWYCHGIKHRIDGPAVTYWHDNDNESYVIEEWWNDGILNAKTVEYF